MKRLVSLLISFFLLLVVCASAEDGAKPAIPVSKELADLQKAIEAHDQQLQLQRQRGQSEEHEIEVLRGQLQNRDSIMQQLQQELAQEHSSLTELQSSGKQSSQQTDLAIEGLRRDLAQLNSGLTEANATLKDMQQRIMEVEKKLSKRKRFLLF